MKVSSFHTCNGKVYIDYKGKTPSEALTREGALLIPDAWVRKCAVALYDMVYGPQGQMGIEQVIEHVQHGLFE